MKAVFRLTACENPADWKKGAIRSTSRGVKTKSSTVPVERLHSDRTTCPEKLARTYVGAPLVGFPVPSNVPPTEICPRPRGRKLPQNTYKSVRRHRRRCPRQYGDRVVGLSRDRNPDHAALRIGCATAPPSNAGIGSYSLSIRSFSSRRSVADASETTQSSISPDCHLNQL